MCVSILSICEHFSISQPTQRMRDGNLFPLAHFFIFIFISIFFFWPLYILYFMHDCYCLQFLSGITFSRADPNRLMCPGPPYPSSSSDIFFFFLATIMPRMYMYMYTGRVLDAELIVRNAFFINISSAHLICIYFFAAFVASISTRGHRNRGRCFSSRRNPCPVTRDP